MIACENRHDLAIGQSSLAVAVAFTVTVTGGQIQVFLKFCTQFLVKLVNNTENFINFFVGNHHLVILYK